MPTRDSAPIGAPCWADLWTSDVDGSRRFYGELFGWEAAAPDPQYGGYFQFLLNGQPVAGGMGDMGDMKATDTWKIYLSTPDIDDAMTRATAAGAQVISPAMAVGDLGTQTVLIDPSGAHLGAWQPNTFPGFTVLAENGAPSWFELFTRDHAASVEFYRSVFGWKTETVGDTDAFRYTVLKADGEQELAGIMDASGFLPDGVPAHWSVYWEVDNPDDTVVALEKLGGSVVQALEDTPYGRTGAMADPTGAIFKLRGPTTD